MSGTNGMVASSKGMSTLARPRFGPGMLLHHEDLEQLSSSARELNRLMFRSLFGCGVICGLVVKIDEKCGKVCLTVGAGVGLGCSGDPVHVPKDHSFPIDEHCSPDIPADLWVVLCGTVKCCAPRTSLCASEEDEAPAVCTRERDGFEIRVLRERPKCVCGCPEPEDRDEDVALLIDTKCKCVNPELECYEDHYAGKCGCSCDDCSDCDCDCVLLARLHNEGDNEDPDWTVDHSVRRFIRPVLMRDPQVELEVEARLAAQKSTKQEAAAMKAAAKETAKGQKPSIPKKP